ncbi:hypothetical protein GCM10027446_33060 [Angustibacter peucedani]
MTGPLNSPTVPLVRPDVAAYVAQVRAHLADLSPEVVEELSGGLEADLGDLAAESDVPLEQRVGPPSDYADELRAAAELPPRPAGGRARVGPVEQLRTDLAGLTGSLRAQPWWPGVASFFTTVRPAWWVARALLAVWVVAEVLGLGSGLLGWVLAAAAVVVSVELGRGRWTNDAVRVLTVLGNVVAVLVLLVFLGSQSSGGNDSVSYDGPYPGDALQDGVVTNNGSTVTNLFAYDGEGRPLTGVQLFDQDGRPLAVDPAQGDPYLQDDQGLDVGRYVPRTDVFGRQVPNAFPLAVQPLAEADCSQGCVDEGPVPTGTPTLPSGPQASVPALAPLQGVGATPAPTGTGSPTAAATGSPSATATGTASPTRR